MTTSPALAFVNAHLEGENEIVALHRDDRGRLKERRFPAQWVSYHARVDLDAAAERILRQSRYVRALLTEGSWFRVQWSSRQAREDALYDERSAFNRAGVMAYEGDVHPVVRWLVDSGLTIARPKRCYLDLESDSRVPFSRKEEMRILTWAVVAQDGRRFSGVLDADTDKAEHGLLNQLWEVLKEFDQVLAWNGDNFDFPLLFARSKARGCAVDVRRWLWLDHLTLFKRMNMHSAESGDEKQSMKLEDIGQSITGRGKLPSPEWVREKFGDAELGSITWQLWELGGEFRKLLADYNVEDTALLASIEEETGYAELFQALAEASGIFADSSGLNPTHQVDGFMLRLGRARDYRFPTKQFRESVEQFKGAYVMQPRTVPGEAGKEVWTVQQAAEWRMARGMINGIARNVHCCDFAAMYPSMIISWNLSPETKRPGAVNGPVPPGMSRCPTTGSCFDVNATGMLPLALREMMKLRKYWNDLKASLPPGTPEWQDADRRSTAYKVAANSFYGVVGSPFSRYFDRAVAEGCTQNGVWLIKQTIAEIESRGWSALYGDSVTGDRVIVMKDPGGRVQLLPIEQLWERSTPLLSEGKKSRATLNGWRALAKNGEVEGWFPVEQILRHRAKKATWRLSTKHGQTHVTTDHGIMCVGRETRPEDFVKERKTFTIVPAMKERVRNEIDLYEYVRDVEHESTGGRSKVRFIPSEEWIEFAAMGSPPVKVRRYYRKGTPEREALLRLVAAYVSDGSASVQDEGSVRSMLSFCKADLALQEQLVSDLNTISPGLPVFGPYWTETVYVVRSGTHGMARLFKALCGAGSKNKRFPDFIYELDEAGFTVVREGLEKGDGSLDAAGMLCFTTTSQQLAAGVSYLLSQHGHPHGWHYRESKGAWTLRTRKGKERPSRYKINAEVFEPDAEEWVYDLSVKGAHTFVDGIGRVLLHNTDSAMIIGPEPEEFSAFVKWCNAELYPRLLKQCGCRENIVKLAYEKEFDRIVFVSAKKYCASYATYKGTAATAESKPEIKGLEYKRGDASKLARTLQAEVIDLLVGGLKIVKDGPVPTTDLEQYHAALDRVREHVLTGPLTLGEVKIAKALSKPLKQYAAKMKLDGTAASQPSHVQVAKVLAGRGREVGEGTRIEYVVTDGSVTPAKVIPAEDFTGQEMDRYHVWETLVFPPTLRLLGSAFPDHDWTPWAKVRPKTPRKGRGRVLAGQLALPEPTTPVEQWDYPEGAEPRGLASGRASGAPSARAGESEYDGSGPFVLELEEKHLFRAEKLRDLLAQHPGDRPVELRVEFEGGASATLACDVRVSGDELLRLRVGELLGAA